MKSDSIRNNRKALAALLLCTGLVAGHPLAVMAESNEAGMEIVQQQVKVSGVVKDVTGEPVIGASVLEKGTSNGIITDINGNFSLAVNPGATLVISYIGYKTQEVQAVAGKVINVMLKDDTEMLDEVVVVGFGVQKKVNLTGSVGIATAKEIESRPVGNSGFAGIGARTEDNNQFGAVGEEYECIRSRYGYDWFRFKQFTIDFN